MKYRTKEEILKEKRDKFFKENPMCDSGDIPDSVYLEAMEEYREQPKPGNTIEEAEKFVFELPYFVANIEAIAKIAFDYANHVNNNSNWISAEERLPECKYPFALEDTGGEIADENTGFDSDNVLVCDEYGISTGHCTKYNDGDIVWYADSDDIINATHWQPLPQKPQQ